MPRVHRDGRPMQIVPSLLGHMVLLIMGVIGTVGRDSGAEGRRTAVKTPQEPPPQPHSIPESKRVAFCPTAVSRSHFKHCCVQLGQWRLTGPSEDAAGRFGIEPRRTALATPLGMIVGASMLFIAWKAHSTAAPGFGLMFEPEYGQAPGRLW